MARDRVQAGGSGSSVDELLDRIRSAFPVFADFLPLAPGIDQELTQHYPGTDNWRLIAALRRHRNDNRYLKAQLRLAERYSLRGEPVAEVTERQRAFVAERLRRRLRQGEDGAGSDDPLEDVKAGQRLMLVKQASHRFGPETGRRAGSMLGEVCEEKVLEELGEALLDSFTPEEWLASLERRLPHDGTPGG